jgi:hypothetical protein
MNPRLSLSGILIAGTILLSGCTSLSQRAGPADLPYKEEVSAGLEEIYVVRTTRTQYTRGATPACAAALFTVRQANSTTTPGRWRCRVPTRGS